MTDHNYVTDARPGARIRPARDEDALTHIDDDGTMTIPEDVEVIEYDGGFWFRTPRLRGWAAINGHSPVMGKDIARSAHVVIHEEMARQHRIIPRWTQARANENKRDTC